MVKNGPVSLAPPTPTLVFDTFWSIPSRGMALKRLCPNSCPIEFSVGIILYRLKYRLNFALRRFREEITAKSQTLFYRDTKLGALRNKCPVKLKTSN